MSITVRQVAEAMIADTTPKTINRFYRANSHRSCAIGGSALVLGILAEKLADALSAVERDGVPTAPSGSVQRYLGGTIIDWNDRSRKTKAQIGHIILDNADEDTLSTLLKGL